MPFVTRKTFVAIGVVAAVAALAATGFVWSGVYNIGADDHHWRSTYAVLEALRERSINSRAAQLQVPTDLAAPARIRQGAGNYAAMCAGCHLAPGMQGTEMSKGLYPPPPNLATDVVDPAHAFWVIKHGIKASGMPAWGLSMEDEYIWNMAAFLQQLPKLDAAQYEALVASSEGHSHGGGETQPHEHPAGMEHGAMGAGEAKPHTHPPGTPAHDDGIKAGADESKLHTDAPGAPPHEHASPRATAPVDEAKPHSHAPGTPLHDDGTKSATPDVPTATSTDAAMPEEHDEHDHQH